jgi:hypothetical protein
VQGSPVILGIVGVGVGVAVLVAVGVVVGVEVGVAVGVEVGIGTQPQSTGPAPPPSAASDGIGTHAVPGGQSPKQSPGPAPPPELASSSQGGNPAVAMCGTATMNRDNSSPMLVRLMALSYR